MSSDTVTAWPAAASPLGFAHVEITTTQKTKQERDTKKSKMFVETTQKKGICYVLPGFYDATDFVHLKK
jgi:hypothetical protein